MGHVPAVTQHTVRTPKAGRAATPPERGETEAGCMLPLDHHPPGREVASVLGSQSWGGRPHQCPLSTLQPTP